MPSRVLGASITMEPLPCGTAPEISDDLTPADLFPRRETAARADTVSATDGNHGRAVAWFPAQQLGKAVIYMPRGSDPARRRISRSNRSAEAGITDLKRYDDAVRLAWKMACEKQLDHGAGHGVGRL